MRWVRTFEEGSADDRDLLGGKGANLAEMTRMGLAVPPGFTVTTDACRAYRAAGGELPEGLEDELETAVSWLEERTGRRLGDPDRPLFVSVRSGARFSMPGMMDTVLNLGMTPETSKGFADETGDPHLALDAERRFVEMYAEVVMGVDPDALEAVTRPILTGAGVDDPASLSAEDLCRLVAAQRRCLHEIGAAIPQRMDAQLLASVEAVFRSWDSERAQIYRQLESIPDDLGTAVTIQLMVFGNRGGRSGTGVAFTRDPATGEPQPYGDWLQGAQGEDVVAGTRVTRPLAELGDVFPACDSELQEVMDRLEERFREMCDIEFTIEDDRLWILQTRTGKRTARAAVRIATDMVDEGLIDTSEAVRRVRPEHLERLLHPQFDPEAVLHPLTTGLPASPGAAVGAIALDSATAESWAAEGRDVVLVRTETSPADLGGIVAAAGVLTARGGLVSHAAVVARGIGKPAVCGAADLSIDLSRRVIGIGDAVLNEGEVIAIDGGSGVVVSGTVPVVEPSHPAALERLLSWADDFRRLGVRANADTAEDARRARRFGAEGIGLCRTEHMFLGDRLPTVREVLLAPDAETERRALRRLHDVQRADFGSLLAETDGIPITVRLLDAPLHEFLPEIEPLAVAAATGTLDEVGRDLLRAARAWDEVNPMLGTRGLRLAILRPELYRTQVRALVGAALARREEGGDPRVQIMVPLVAIGAEFAHVAGDIRATVETLLAGAGTDLEVPVGAMIETPRAAIVAGAIAADADFLSFGTNDLTQMTYGLSRDDVEARVLARYVGLGLIDITPFERLDPEGVGALMSWAVERSRRVDPSLEIGVCGEHGGDPASIRTCGELGLDYVSCSPYRVATARLAAAHAALEDGTDDHDR
jgi:pyruvate, orthophosphate dikinase